MKREIKIDYYDKFNCIADKCSFTCCQEWKIAVDEDTYTKWKNLSIANQKACYIQKIYINKESASLVYHEKNNNKKDNYIGKLNLINEEYIKLYEILCKYQLISYDVPYKELDSLKKQGPT